MYKTIQTKKDIANGVTGTEDEVQEQKVSKSELIMQTALDMFGGRI
jgi:SWI/SNF-related matrix-associated actin-dependent regulator 1 of chromatin subfamily A